MPISEKKWNALKKRMDELNILESDLAETFILSSKKGGQHANKTSTCVQLKHLPTDSEVKCQEYRSQLENRYHARKILCEKIENLVLGKKSPQQIKIAKIQKQKNRRKRKIQKKINNHGNK